MNLGFTYGIVNARWGKYEALFAVKTNWRTFMSRDHLLNFGKNVIDWSFYTRELE